MEQICNVFGICRNEQISNRNKKFELKVLRNGTNLLIFLMEKNSIGTKFLLERISIGTNSNGTNLIIKHF
jgi:hypothetical protein